MFRVMLASDAEVYTSALQRRLKDCCQVRICTDGLAAMAALVSYQPDVLLLDAGLTRKDALSVLRQSVFIPRAVLVYTNYLDGRVLNQLQTLGVRHTLLMPSVRTVEQHIRNYLEEFGADTTIGSLEYRTAMQLHSLGFTPRHEGYRFLCVGLPMLVRNPDQPLVKSLYPAIAEALLLPDWRTVEQAIRKAIKQAWEYRDNDLWSKIFPADSTGNVIHPSNKQFFLHIAYLLHRASGNQN